MDAGGKAYLVKPDYESLAYLLHSEGSLPVVLESAWPINH